jgi:hypothetical protein
VSLVGLLLPVQVTITIVKQFFYEVVFHHIFTPPERPKGTDRMSRLQYMLARQ